MAADLLWFASASLAAGLVAAIVAAALVLLLAQPAYASRPAPRLIAPGAESSIVLQRLSINAEITGSVARTTVEMVFYNPNRRQLEGELQFPLLAGQQVTGFALDIDGKLRSAVVVEKNQGQQVFEDITRRRVDPGLLQATEGNNFKLRVYPIFANSTRTVAISYSENLATSGTQGHYRLPLEYGSKVGDFSLEISVGGASARPRVSGTAARDLTFGGSTMAGVLKARRQNYVPQGVLEVSVSLARGSRVITQRHEGRDYFYAEVPVAARKAKRALPASIGLVWDSSASGAARDHTRELALLDAYFAAVGNAVVHLTRIRDAAETGSTYRIVDGHWQALRWALEETVYDGATNLGAFVPQPGVKEYLLVSDGLANYGDGVFPQVKVPVYAISSSAQANPSWLKDVAHRSGGRYLDLLTDSPAVALERLLFDFERIRAVSSNGATHLVAASPHPVNGLIAVAGVLTEPAADVRVELGLPGRRSRTVTWRVSADTNKSSLAASFWARERIAALEADRDAHRGEILRLGRSFGLVTPETSLIVLETVSDYVAFEIEPPVELIAEYNRMRQGLRSTGPVAERKIERALAMLNSRETWWQRDFPKGAVPVAASQAHIGTYSPSRRAPEPERKDGYLTDGQGAIVRSEAGVCMRSSAWSPALAAAECDPDRVAKPAPKPAPQPAMAMAKPASKPAPNPMAKPMPAKPDMAGFESRLSQGHTSTTPTLVRAWSPAAPYRARLAGENPARAYRIYLDERPSYRMSAAFYLDVAQTLMAKGERPLALRVLSNLAEIDLEDRHTLRSLASRLAEAGEHGLALAVYKRVARLGSEEPQSFRDLGLAYAALGENQRAIDSLYEVVIRSWHARFPEIELIALGELNAIVATSKTALDVSRIDSRLLRNMPLDLRIVLTWDADNTNVDLVVTDPNGHTSAAGAPVTFQGGRMSRNFSGGYGPEEYALRHAKPGTYKVVTRFSNQMRQVVGAGPVYAHVHVFTKFGTGEQSVRSHHVLLNQVGAASTVTEIHIPGSDEGE